ncbi:MAG: FAD-dependent cmnm(5)s(2)U34 oxidoreductase, partial [Alphaproteobacteria bacterium]|nr:FAD-dependent cmnm(5)s(2)U34 oxidoreductase [Alphaproteobacteria bacterium]
MTRLPPQPRIEWRADAPFSLDLEDVYFSGDGLSEKRAVFLDGCHLPGAWAGRERFCIGELGFGAGLNFLAAWDLWRRRRPSPHARLDFVSFEGALLSAADAARIPGAWPELGGLSSILTSRWPIRARGVQRIA